MNVAVVGGGIAGLSAAWALAEAGEQVTVLEAAGQAGGKLRSATVAGVEVDVGAEAMLARRPEGVALARELGLDLIAPTTTAAYVRAGGSLHPLPARTLLGIPADLDAVRGSGALTEHAIARVAAEPGLDPLPPLESDVAVGALVRERLGNEVADRLVEPLLGGVYAGRADEISLRAAIPAVYEQLRAGGSLVHAAQAVVRDPSSALPAGPVFASLPGGLGRLPVALTASGRFAVRTGVTVRSVRRTPTGFALDCGPVPVPELVECDGLVLAVPAAKAARLLHDVAPAAAGELAAIESASVAIVTFAFRSADLPPGSGLLVGTREGLAVKGVTVTSQKWPLDTKLTILRASLGRHGEAYVLQRSDEELVALARHDLQELLGIQSDPVDVLVTRWGGGLPQYAVGHVDRVARVRAAVAAVPRLATCGAAYDGVGIPAVIGSARLAAQALVAQ